jgi:hypothetical protein
MTLPRSVNNGKPLKDYRGAWKAACSRAFLLGRIPHDFRRGGKSEPGSGWGA